MKSKEVEGMKKILKLKTKDIPKERQWLFKEIEKPLKALIRNMLKK